MQKIYKTEAKPLDGYVKVALSKVTGVSAYTMQQINNGSQQVRLRDYKAMLPYLDTCPCCERSLPKKASS